MTSFLKSAVLALALAVSGGAAFAAETCSCCKEGEKMPCCDDMKDKAASPKPGEPQPVQPDHKH